MKTAKQDGFAGGWWSGAEMRPSANFDDRPPHVEIDMLVVHAISLPPGEFGSGDIHGLFCNTLDCAKHPYYAGLVGLKVSAHFLIDRGGQVTQYVPVQQQAWHAGISSFGGRQKCNERSLGIELEGSDECPFTALQINQLIRVSAALFVEFPQLSLAHVVGHADISPNRKTDPGPYFDWIAFRAALAAARRF